MTSNDLNFTLFNAANSSKVDFNMRAVLVTSEPWIQCGKYLDLCYSQRAVVVKVDPTGLPPGVHKGR